MLETPDPFRLMIAQLERRHLDGFRPAAVPLFGQIDGAALLHIVKVARFWEVPPAADPVDRVADLLMGLHEQGAPFIYLLYCDGGRLFLHVGFQGRDTGVLRTALEGMFPGIGLEPSQAQLGSWLKQRGLFAHMGRLTGIPTRKTGASGKPRQEPARERLEPLPPASSGPQMERIVRGMASAPWGYLVSAVPIATQQTAAEEWNLLATIKYYADQSRYSDGQPGLQQERINRHAQLCVELLERQMERLQRGKAEGMWEVETFFFSAQPAALLQLRGLLQGAFAGEASRPDPLRTLLGIPTTSPINVAPASRGSNPPPADEGLATGLTSSELATLAPLLREEFPGYTVTDYVRFDVDITRLRISHPLEIGPVLDGERTVGSTYALERDLLTRHGLIVGVTGSGKTNTCFQFLYQLWGHPGSAERIPFLVIEPAKAEYRDLRQLDEFADLRVYTLGDELVSPFRLNPFEFEPGIHVQTHIDHLKSVFNAAFVLYAPMPYVLEMCLHEVCEDKGWNLASSTIDRRMPDGRSGQEAQYGVFPTLTDLYYKIDEVVARLGYEERIQQDVQAGLKARIGSLRLGGKGLMLDVRCGIPMDELLALPTVLELERIGDDDEKAFLMGLLFVRLYEHRIAQGRAEAEKGERHHGLRHLLLIEEAHRLLRNVPTEVSFEGANVRGKAVETFANMLSEIRSFGQGVLISEQIPTRLAPDAIKNTNLKVLHRLVSADDREVMAGAMNLRPEQAGYVVTFLPGQAAVYSQEDDRPYLVRVPPLKGGQGARIVEGRITDRQVAEAMVRYCGDERYLPRPGCAAHCRARHQAQQRGRCMVAVRNRAHVVLEYPDFPLAFIRYFLSLVEEPAQAVAGYPLLRAVLNRAVLLGEEEADVSLCVLVHAVAQLLEEQGRVYEWPYPVVASFKARLLAPLARLSLDFHAHGPVGPDPAWIIDLVQSFAAEYQEHCAQARQPFAGCEYCLAPCRYRYPVARVANEGSLRHSALEAIEVAESSDALWEGLAEVCTRAARKILTVERAETVRAVALCVAAQLGPQLDFDETSQRKVVRNVNYYLCTFSPMLPGEHRAVQR